MKVAYFDYWTKGYGHFIPFDRELQRQGHSTLLMHVGSLRSPHPLEENRQGLLMRDISYYKTNYIYNMLAAERPDVIVSLNTTYILDRAMVLAARELGIKSVFLMHGNKAWQEQTEARVAIARQSFNSTSMRLSRASKYLRDVIPNYFYSYHKAGATFGWIRPAGVVFKYFVDPGGCFYFPPHPDEIVHDKCLVYAQSDVDHYVKVGYARPNVFVTGNPKLDNLQRRISERDFPRQKLPVAVAKWTGDGQKYAVLIEDSFPESNGGWTVQDRNEYINQVAAALKENGYRLAVKVHPSSRLETIHVADPDVPLYQTESLDDLLYHSAFCITHWSTAVNQAVLLNKAVLQPRWGKSANLLDFYIRRGVSRAWPEPHRLPSLTVPSTSLDGYKREYISVLTPDAAKNVVGQILNWK